MRVLDRVCEGLEEFLDWSDTLGRRLLKKEDQSPSVFLKSWTETFLWSDKIIISYSRKQRDIFQL